MVTVKPPSVVASKSFASNLFPFCVASIVSLKAPTRKEVVIPAIKAFFLSFVFI